MPIIVYNIWLNLADFVSRKFWKILILPCDVLQTKGQRMWTTPFSTFWYRHWLLSLSFCWLSYWLLFWFENAKLQVWCCFHLTAFCYLRWSNLSAVLSSIVLLILPRWSNIFFSYWFFTFVRPNLAAKYFTNFSTAYYGLIISS